MIKSTYNNSKDTITNSYWKFNFNQKILIKDALLFSTKSKNKTTVFIGTLLILKQKQVYTTNVYFCVHYKKNYLKIYSQYKIMFKKT